MKIYQVHDDNYTAFLFLAEHEEAALSQLRERVRSLVPPDELDEYVDSFYVDEVPNGARIDSDVGPICFLSR